MKDYAQELSEQRELLTEYKQARLKIISTGQSWKVRNGDDTRELVNVSLGQLSVLIRECEYKISQLERVVGMVSPNGICVGARCL